MTNDNPIRWSGLAAAIGGPLWLLPWTGWLGDIDDSAGFLIALVGMALLAFGLFGLYKRLSAGGRSRRNTLVFGVALAGVLLIMASALGGLLTDAPLSGSDETQNLAILLAAGIIFLIVGLAGMGLISISERALGGLSFTPILLAISLLGYIVGVGMSVADAGNDSLRDIADFVVIGCWLLFGAALWLAKEPIGDRAIPA